MLRWGSKQDALGSRATQSSGKSRHSWPRRPPGSPAQPWEGLAGHRPWDRWLRFTGSPFRETFFSFPMLCSRPTSRGSPRKNAFMQTAWRRSSPWWSPFFPLLISFRVDVGLSVVFHILLILWAHNSRLRIALGTFLPVIFRHGLMFAISNANRFSLPHFQPKSWEYDFCDAVNIAAFCSRVYGRTFFQGWLQMTNIPAGSLGTMFTWFLGGVHLAGITNVDRYCSDQHTLPKE